MVGLMQALLMVACLMLAAPSSQGAPISSVYHQNVTVFSTTALVRQYGESGCPSWLPCTSMFIQNMGEPLHGVLYLT